ncbi:GlsB/YeaQ/YmgE family stress response membrane protein [Actinoalloteichus hymeniacidonis]|uniref:Membrane protein n=1 Tax=Actinoalloteichus hymeniacidonis TaxID=340345 RepID=A0AAC9HNM8_9PSEU|nr:GlsB/YeaQ/YmgE family stress response membrane protein [Actinoalloteichus hymeniacidonis]AOS62602.1 putative membrane protein [Actinoalloteichus hymeniacidonis]MBB5909366.1 putative membrane protein YeaQ/YmgE (transglycosylase-associated protein family) [Actinoalloteichus hymeniacidonis]
MGILGWIVLGLLAGAIAKAIMPGKDPGGIFMTLLLGVVGALLGGWIGSALFGTELRDFFSIQTWLIAIIGSIVLLAIYRMVVGRRGHGQPRAHA